MDHSSSQDMMSYLNGIFLIGPPLGAALTGLFKCYYVTILNIIQVIFLFLIFISNILKSIIFFLLLFPVLLPTRGLITYPVWAVYLCTLKFRVNFVLTISSNDCIFIDEWVCHNNVVFVGETRSWSKI